jgi:thiamine biosynthesis lipoprotein
MSNRHEMSEQKVLTASWFGMNTDINCTVTGGKAEAVVRAMQEEVRRLESMLSRYRKESDITHVNANAGACMIPVGQETLEVLSKTMHFSALSDGAFDVTIGPLVDLWDYRHAVKIPSPRAIERTRMLVDGRSLWLDHEHRMCGLAQYGQSLDLGGIGKGFAARACVDVMRTYDVESAFFNFGGHVATIGPKPDGSDWTIGIRHPRKHGHLVGSVRGNSSSVVTSGDYERYFTDREGTRWHHILDPKTGYPARSGMCSVTVVHEDSLLADVLSTTCFIIGIERSVDLLSKIPGTGVIFVDERLRLWITRDLLPQFTSSGELPVFVV